MKKVLIIGYLCPYCEYQGGSPRTLGLANYLSEFGWQPIVLTPLVNQKSDFRFRIIETPYCDVITSLKKKLHLNPNKGFQEQIGISSLADGETRKSFTSKLITRAKGIITYPDINRGWKLFAIDAGTKLLEREKIDAMISVWPITAHLVARELKNKYKIPWIADFSHFWSQGYYYPYGPIRRLLDKKLEVKTLLKADALMTISQFFAKKLRELHNQQPIFAITHGFDPSSINIPSVSLTNKFSITYTGNVYPGKQKTSKFFAALRELAEDKLINRRDIEVLFYGVRHEWLEKEINQYGLSDVVHQYGVVSHSLSLQKQRESQILLYFGWDDKQIEGFYTSKIFEYLAAQRPTLAIGGASDEVVKDLLSETKAGVYSREIEDIKRFLKKFYLEYKRKGKVNYGGDIEKINKYSHREMTRKFVDILNRIT